jgi:hypothetical protein
MLELKQAEEYYYIQKNYYIENFNDEKINHNIHNYL